MRHSLHSSSCFVNEVKLDDDVSAVLHAFSGHVAKPFTRPELLAFAEQALKHPDVFLTGKDVPNTKLYRGYRKLHRGAVLQLAGSVEPGVYPFHASKRDVSWSPDRDVAFTVALPDEPRSWYAVACVESSTGTWVFPGPGFVSAVIGAGIGKIGDASVMESECLMLSPPKRPGSVAVVYAHPDNDFSDVAGYLDELVGKL